MIIKVTEIGIRPNSSVSWNKILTNDVIEATLDYINSNRLLGRHQINDKNTNSTTQYWDNVESYNLYLKDPRLQQWFENMKEYRLKNNINITKYTVEEVDEKNNEVSSLLNKFTIKDENGNEIPFSYFMK